MYTGTSPSSSFEVFGIKRSIVVAADPVRFSVLSGSNVSLGNVSFSIPCLTPFSPAPGPVFVEFSSTVFAPHGVTTSLAASVAAAASFSALTVFAHSALNFLSVGSLTLISFISLNCKVCRGEPRFYTIWEKESSFNELSFLFTVCTFHRFSGPHAYHNAFGQVGHPYCRRLVSFAL